MLFTYVKLNNQETKLNTELQVLNISNQKIAYFSNKQFNEYRKILEQDNRTISVIRNTKLKKVSPKERNQIFSDEYKEKYSNKDFLKIEDTYYHLIDERSCSAKGYLYVGDDKFIRIEKSNACALILLPILLATTIGVGLYIKTLDNEPSSKVPVIEGSEETPSTDSSSIDNSRVKFAGFKTAVVSKTSPYIKLDNNSGSNFGYIYQISEKKGIEVVETFTSYDDAKKYVMNNSSVVENNYEADGYQVKVDGKTSKYFSELSIFTVSENKYNVIKTDYEVLYFTGAIKSGGYVKWNAYEMLPNTTDVHIVVSAYNIDKETYDTSMAFDATIVKK